MRINFTIIFLSLYSVILFGQQEYFQQKVDVKISCTLNDVDHILSGDITMHYTNNSKEALDKIYMHLWPNAYQDVNTGYARQKVRMGDTEFYFSEDADKGNIGGLAFEVNHTPVIWESEVDNPDIAILHLSESINPGKTAVIKTPFILKIPKSFSRLGHVGQSYQMTQWFPKPAVYDQDGWHPMPYLDIGEFYSEFGDYEVEITLPSNYIVSATGVLQEESERDFLQEKMLETEELIEEGFDMLDHSFPESSSQLKTISYKAENVHDFAWFADKRFHVMKSNVELSSGDNINTWTFFTNYEANLWIDAIKYVDRSVKFYSDHVGNYPYPQATAVQSALSAGGGMEYPMITVIGLMGSAAPLDNVITHEVGHNWFYGILAFNERDHVWLDEGINSYYDHRYMDDYYENYSSVPLPPLLLGHSEVTGEEYALLYKMRRGDDQAPTTHSNKFKDEINYFLGGYEKPARAFHHLELYLGKDVFDPIMKSFFEKWKFKHPQPQDLRAHFEASTDKNLNWFFDGLIGSNKSLDVGIGKYDSKTNQLSLKNNGSINAPIPLGVTTDEEQSTVWVEGFEKKTSIGLDARNIKKIEIDPNHDILELKRSNNYWNADRMFKKHKPFEYQLISRLENPRTNQLFILPAMGWNNYDKYMLGIGLHNFGLLQRGLEFGLFPMYGFGSEELTGLATIRKHWLVQKDWAHQITLGVNAKKFTFDSFRFQSEDRNEGYIRLNPYLELELTSKKAKPTTKKLRFDFIHNSVDYNLFLVEGELSEETENHEIYRLSYSSKNTHAIRPSRFVASVEFQDFELLPDMTGLEPNPSLKLSLTYQQSYQYKKGRYFDWRFFGGWFPLNEVGNGRQSSNSPLFFYGTNISLIQQGSMDYAFDDYYFGRSEQTGIWSQQISGREGFFKTPIVQKPNSFSRLGISNEYAFALNLSSDLPFKLPAILPIRAYADLGYFEDPGFSSSESFLFSGGLMLSYADGGLEIYFPLVNSSNIEDAFDSINGDYWTRVSFKLNIKTFDPTEIRNSVF